MFFFQVSTYFFSTLVNLSPYRTLLIRHFLVKVPFVDYNNVSDCVGKELHALNFYVNTSGVEAPRATLGVYHVLPRSLGNEKRAVSWQFV